MVNAVIFDMDGLLIDSEKFWFDVWPEALGRFGYSMPEGFFEKTLGINVAAQADLLRETFGEDAPVQQIQDTFEEIGWSKRANEPFDVMEGAFELLDWLVENDIPRAVASSSSLEEVQARLGETGLIVYFEHIVSGRDFGRGKPEPDVFLAAAKQLGVEPSSTLVLEDSNVGVEAGHAGGFITIMVPDAGQPTLESLERAYACCKNLNEVLSMLQADEIR